MSNDKVVAMPGASLPAKANEPNLRLAAALEKLAQQARDGELHSLMGVYEHNGHYGRIMSNGNLDPIGMHGALHLLLLEHANRHRPMIQSKDEF